MKTLLLSLLACASMAAQAQGVTVAVPESLTQPESGWLPCGATVVRYTGAASQAVLVASADVVLSDQLLPDREASVLADKLGSQPRRLLVTAYWPQETPTGEQRDPRLAFNGSTPASHVWYGYVNAAKGGQPPARAQAIADWLKGLPSCIGGGSAAWIAPPEAIQQSNLVTLGLAAPVVPGGYR
jgi:hypothetical protein